MAHVVAIGIANVPLANVLCDFAPLTDQLNRVSPAPRWSRRDGTRFQEKFLAGEMMKGAKDARAGRFEQRQSASSSRVSGASHSVRSGEVAEYCGP